MIRQLSLIISTVCVCSAVVLYIQISFCTQRWARRRPVSLAFSSESGTSGNLFEGNVIRRLPSHYYRFSNLTYIEIQQAARKRKSLLFSGIRETTCKRWVVVTTIFEPTESVKKAAQLDQWCVVVVADLKSPSIYNVNNVIYLSVDDQKVLSTKFNFVHQIPWNHFGRKNIGFFYAILHGAEYIFDLDDDNVLQQSSMIPPQRVMDLNTVNCSVFNVYSVMGPTTTPTWPRGFPLEHLKQYCNYVMKPNDVVKENIVIFQSLANHDPDVDAIYRMTLPLPFTFTANFSLGIPKKVFSPYNAQASLHYKKSFWGLLLPITVHGRVSDIWRSYFTQRLLWDIDSRIAFLPAWVKQFRNPHNYIQDFQAETNLYLKSDALLKFLLSWKGQCVTLPGRLEELYIALYERDFVGQKDVDLLQTWIDALITIEYEFPELT